MPPADIIYLEQEKSQNQQKTDIVDTYIEYGFLCTAQIETIARSYSGGEKLLLRVMICKLLVCVTVFEATKYGNQLTLDCMRTVLTNLHRATGEDVLPGVISKSTTEIIDTSKQIVEHCLLLIGNVLQYSLLNRISGKGGEANTVDISKSDILALFACQLMRSFSLSGITTATQNSRIRKTYSVVNAHMPHVALSCRI
jgi:hypothetical protein